MPTLTIDDRQVSSPDGTTVIQAAETLGIFVPRYCYHPALSVAGNCRICLVEVEKTAKLQIACNTPVTEGMVVHTKSEKAEDGRRAVLEFLLANHPLDCPVCDQSGECELQNFYMNFGLYDARFREQKVKKKKAVAVGPHVMLDQERCILCSRCVRFTDEITRTGEFGIFNRGDRAELGLYPGQALNNPYSGNVIDVCPGGCPHRTGLSLQGTGLVSLERPVGVQRVRAGLQRRRALHARQAAPERRRARHAPEASLQPGRQPVVDVRRGALRLSLDRPRTPDARPTSRHGVDVGAGPRRHQCGARARARGDSIATVGPARAGATRLGVIASTGLSNEELFLIREVLQRGLGASVTAAVPEPPGYSDDFLIKADKSPNTRGATVLGLAGPDAPSVDSILADAHAGTYRHALGLRARSGGAHRRLRVRGAVAQLSIS